MNNELKLALVFGTGLAILVGLARAKEEKGKITAVELTPDKRECTSVSCTVAGRVKWKNVGRTISAFTPKLVSEIGELLASQPEQVLGPDEEYMMPFTITIVKDTLLCPVPN